MSEVLLNVSETRPPRSPSEVRPRSTVARRIVIGSLCAAGLAGFAVAASSVMEGLVSPPVLRHGPAIGQGLATSWPDLKDGLPPKAGIVVKTADSSSDAPAPTRIAALQTPMSPPTTAPATPASTTPAKPAASASPQPQSPTARFPVPTEVSVVSKAPVARLIGPTRTLTALAPRPSETVRAREEVKPAEAPAPVAERAAPAAATPKPAKAIATAKPASPEPSKVATAKPAAPKPAAAKAGSANPVVTQTAEAEPDANETEILGVKLPSLAPAGRKLQDSVSALGDAVRNAF